MLPSREFYSPVSTFFRADKEIDLMKKQGHNKFSSRCSFVVKNLILPAALLLLSGVNALAQPTPTPTPKPTPTLPSLDDVKVRDVTVPNFPEKRRAGIGDEIDVQVENLQNFLNYASCLSENDEPVSGCKPQKITLFIDGREMKGHEPEARIEVSWYENDPNNPAAKPLEVGILQFHLEYIQGVNDEVWSDLLGGQNNSSENFRLRPIYVSVGFENGAALDVKSKEKFNLVLMHLDWRLWVCAILIITILFYLIQLARNTELLRDGGVLPDSPKKVKKWWLLNREVRTVHKPYSSARVQMAFWFALVIVAFLYIWLVTGASDTITTTVLALIGIAAGTALGAAVIDKGKKPDDEPAKDAKPQVSQSFLIDVLTDENGGISFHRFQMLTWMWILGVLFVFQVFNTLTMPEFSATLLGLLGISNGTYLGFKIPESGAPG
jgi:hypothetical protein